MNRNKQFVKNKNDCWMTFLSNFLSLSSLQNNMEDTSTFLSAGAALKSCLTWRLPGWQNEPHGEIHSTNVGASTTKACLEEKLSGAVVQWCSG